eukprot:RCo037051
MQGFDLGGLAQGWNITTKVGSWGDVHPRELRNASITAVTPTRDLPLDILPPEGIAAVKRKVDWSVFLFKNEQKYQKEMNLLLPREYQEWDPTQERNILIPFNPLNFAIFFGLATSYYHNVVNHSAWYRGPWRIPGFIAAFYALFYVWGIGKRQSALSSRKVQLLANNYYKRVREAVIERERRRLGHRQSNPLFQA